ncbi:glycosyltransferase [Pseudobutyrivibrio xylanivorans]|uniref:Glycosyl transferases group 1 n=1 Tax=Pseudobutyrivibrio xylanivorans TaxID=185007 RepID=A0A1G5S488_PSEXY|nr:glycosyltransferase [Pseudobutyrivibrio xylanivorans]SCZ81232.1 Glycosyl transferases group 1 [Pseudobutyrivibrio xylanivorans]
MKLLIVSNNALELSDSNGRTLGKLVQGVDNSEKIQFCLRGNAISQELIDECYQISDKDVVKGITKRDIKATKLSCFCEYKNENNISKGRAFKRNALTMIIRELVWQMGMHKLEFLNIAEHFKPDIILYMLGDNAFMPYLVMRLADKTKAKIVVFTTEDYYFKNWDYMKQCERKSLIYRLFHLEYRKSIRKIFKKCSTIVTHTPYLADEYKNEFGVNSSCIMTSASENDITDVDPNGEIIYAGNLGLNRHLGLIQISEVLSNYDEKLVIYGNGEENIISQLKKHKNIEYRGMIGYKELQYKIKGAKLVVHTESFDPFFVKDSRAAFSTKIADSLSSGVPFLVYVPESINLADYLKKYKCAYVCTSVEDLDKIVKEALYDENSRKNIVDNAAKCVSLNHNEGKNARKMRQILEGLV